MTFDTKRTADYSPLVVHFTKSARMVRDDLILNGDPLFGHKQNNAKERLMSILGDRVIYDSPMPFLATQPRAVCFTECIWDGLTSLSDQYSAYGIVFSKRMIFDLGGGPALYVRGDTMVAVGNQIPDLLHPFIAPFDPDAKIRPGVPLDWLHEREWRLPKSLEFTFANIEYVLVESIQEATELVHQIGAQQLPESKVIPMEVYRNIKRTWSLQ